MKLKLIGGVLLAVNLSACATITKGKTNEVEITSTPSEANVSITEIANRYDGAECVTPCTARLNRKGSYQTTVSKDGYTSFSTTLVPKFSGSGGTALAGNLLVGGVIGAGIDAATGATKDLSPNPLNVTLSPTGQDSFATDKKGNKVVPKGERPASAETTSETATTSDAEAADNS